MRAMTVKKRESFPDGIAIISDNIAKNGVGNIPGEKLKERCRLRFREKTVGMNRFYSALQNNSLIERMIRCPRRSDVSVLDIVQLIPPGSTKDYYKIAQIQYPEDVDPAVMDISLERVDVT